MRWLLLLSCILASSPTFAATPLPKAPDGFRVELVLEAPAIESPTALCVAPNGDVYFAEDPMDMSGPPTKNLDRIWMLKGGDPGQRVLIADHLWAVMGLEIVGNKLYVVHAPHVTVFTLNADGKVRDRTELFDDLGPPVAGVPSFNDHIPSGIRMGMDGWLYVSIGDKGIPRMTRKERGVGSVNVAEGRWRHTKEGRSISLEGGGVIRFRPDGSDLEVFASGTRNHLDVPMDQHDRIFVRDNTDDGDGWNTRFMYLPHGGFPGYPWAFKQQPEETLPLIHDFGGGAPCQGCVYLDDGLPETYRGRVFHCEWGQGKVWAVKVEPDGASFRYVDQIQFLDPANVKDFRPFSIRPTADGRGFYVTDWGYSGWLQKLRAGRIYKVTYVRDDVKPAPRGKESDSIAQLLAALDHPAHSERLRAQRALTTRGGDAVKAVAAQLRANKLSARALPHALWILAAASPDAGWVKLAQERIGDTSPEVRQEAIRALGTNPEAWSGRPEREVIAATLLERLRSDDSAPVRLQAALALPGTLEPLHLPELLRLAGSERDTTVRFALVRAIRQAADWKVLAKDFPEALDPVDRSIAEVLFRSLAEQFNPAAVAVLEKLAASPRSEVRRRAVEELARVYKDRKPYPGTWWGTRPEQQKPPARVVAWDGTPIVRDAILHALADRDAPVRKTAVAALIVASDPTTLAPLEKQFKEEKDAETRLDLVRAIAGLQQPRALDFLRLLAVDAGQPDALRIEAVAGLEKLNTPEASRALAGCLAGKSSAAFVVRVLQALATTHPAGAHELIAGTLHSEEPSVRAAAATALAQLGKPDASRLLMPLLNDRETAVQIAAIHGLATLKSRETIPALVAASTRDATQFEAILALTQLPDARALSAYLTGLGSKNADLRSACRQALATIREQVVPTLEELVKRNEIRADLLPELRAIYSSYAPILSWRLIGPFPNDGKAYPPERELKFDAVYDGATREARWRERRADARLHGRIKLDTLYQPSTDVVAYGHAEIESPTARDAQLLIGSDDTIVVWLNGKKVHEFLNNRGWSHDADKVNVHLEAGKNQLLVRCGNTGGAWEFSVAVSGDVERYAFLKGGARKFDLEEFRAYARKIPGDAERGRRLFLDLKGLACVKCHALGGVGGQVGPDLAGIALKYKREDLMTSVLEPSKVIAQGYETLVLTTKKGKVLTGVFKGETEDAVNFADAEGRQQHVLKKDIDERSFSPVSVMPNGLNEGMTLQDFADLVAFLEARREEKVVPRK